MTASGLKKLSLSLSDTVRQNSFASASLRLFLIILSKPRSEQKLELVETAEGAGGQEGTERTTFSTRDVTSSTERKEPVGATGAGVEKERARGVPTRLTLRDIDRTVASIVGWYRNPVKPVSQRPQRLRDSEKELEVLPIRVEYCKNKSSRRGRRSPESSAGDQSVCARFCPPPKASQPLCILLDALSPAVFANTAPVSQNNRPFVKTPFTPSEICGEYVGMYVLFGGEYETAKRG
jgi:hypothetical protein